MTEWIKKCEKILTQFKAENGIPYDYKRFENKSGQLPDTFIVYFLVSDPPKSHYDGKETAHETKIQVSLFYRNKSTFLTIPEKIKASFMGADFMRVNSRELPYQPDTGHYGWCCDFNFYERRNINE